MPGNRHVRSHARSQSTGSGSNYQPASRNTRGVANQQKNIGRRIARNAGGIELLAFLVFKIMAFFQSAVGSLQTIVIALGAGLGVWGAINLLEGYGNDNPGAKSQGMKQLMAGGGVALVGTTLVPLLAGLF